MDKNKIHKVSKSRKTNAGEATKYRKRTLSTYQNEETDHTDVVSKKRCLENSTTFKNESHTNGNKSNPSTLTRSNIEYRSHEFRRKQPNVAGKEMKNIMPAKTKNLADSRMQMLRNKLQKDKNKLNSYASTSQQTQDTSIVQERKKYGTCPDVRDKPIKFSISPKKSTSSVIQTKAKDVSNIRNAESFKQGKNILKNDQFISPKTLDKNLFKRKPPELSKNTKLPYTVTSNQRIRSSSNGTPSTNISQTNEISELNTNIFAEKLHYSSLKSPLNTSRTSTAPPALHFNQSIDLTTSNQENVFSQKNDFGYFNQASTSKTGHNSFSFALPQNKTETPLNSSSSTSNSSFSNISSNYVPENYHTSELCKGKRQSRSLVQERLQKYNNVQNTSLYLTDTEIIFNNNGIGSFKEATNFNQSFVSNDEEMDWEPVTEDVIINEINTVRNKKPMCPNQINETTLLLMQHQNIAEVNKEKLLHIVVDTNVFISGLKVIEDITRINLSENVMPIIVIPWTVIQELDYLKDRGNETIKYQAQNAIKFINKLLTSRSPALKCQTCVEAAQNNILTKSSDDEILNCCLKYFNENETILLTNDINLQNKAMIHHLAAFSSKTVLNFVINDYKKRLQLPKVSEIKTEITYLCDLIIRKELQRADNRIENNFPKMKYNIIECLECFKYYWKTIFCKRLHSDCFQLIVEFHEFLQNTVYIKEDDVFNQFMRYCFDLCIHLKMNYKEYQQEVINSIDKLKVLAEN